MGMFRNFRRRFLPPSQANLFSERSKVVKSIRAFEGEWAQQAKTEAESLDSIERKLSAIDERLDALDASLSRLYARVEQTDFGINDNLNFKFGEHCRLRDELSVQLKTHDAQAKMLAWEILRGDLDTLDDVRMRYFANMPKATGDMRLLQSANLRLLRDFAVFCDEHELSYFLISGTLLGAVRHRGFIPWDDDLDVGMLHDDLERLISEANVDDRYRVTVVYDQYVSCKQVRFRYADPALPSFVDVFYWDYCRDDGDKTRVGYSELRNDVIAEIGALKDKGVIDGFYLDQGGPGSDAAEAVFDNARKSAMKCGLVVPEGEANCISWGIENLNPVSRVADMYFPLDVVYPLRKVEFEGASFSAPADSEEVLRLIYGDWLELPDDMFSHFKHVELSHDALQALRAFESSCEAAGSAEPSRPEGVS